MEVVGWDELENAVVLELEIDDEELLEDVAVVLEDTVENVLLVSVADDVVGIGEV